MHDSTKNVSILEMMESNKDLMKSEDIARLKSELELNHNSNENTENNNTKLEEKLINTEKEKEKEIVISKQNYLKIISEQFEGKANFIS